MSRTKVPLPDRVARAAEAALEAQNYVSAIDVFARIGWLPLSVEQSWRRGQIASLKDAKDVAVDLSRIPQALALLKAWANERNLAASPTDYLARTLQHQALRFSRNGDPAIEAACRTHWVSQALSEKQGERLAEKVNRAPELVVVIPLKDGWSCHRCGQSDGWLIMENPGPACLRCAGLDDLEYLPAGDAQLSRRTKAASSRHAVVVRFSRTRKRYERQGLLVEPQALADAQRALEAQAAKR